MLFQTRIWIDLDTILIESYVLMFNWPDYVKFTPEQSGEKTVGQKASPKLSIQIGFDYRNFTLFLFPYFFSYF